MSAICASGLSSRALHGGRGGAGGAGQHIAGAGTCGRAGRQGAVSRYRLHPHPHPHAARLAPCVQVATGGSTGPHAGESGTCSYVLPPLPTNADACMGHAALNKACLYMEQHMRMGTPLKPLHTYRMRICLYYYVLRAVWQGTDPHPDCVCAHLC